MSKGFLGSHHTEEAKLKNRLAHLGKHHSEESKKKVSASLKGRYVSGETRQKMSLAQKDRIITPEARMEISEAIKELWRNEQYRKIMLEANRLAAESRGLEISKAKKGMVSTFKGRKHTEEAKRKNRLAHKKLWEDPQYRALLIPHLRSEEMFRARLAGLLKRPTKPEQKLIELLEKTGLPFRYVGDGKLIIDGKCPDFVNVNGKKQLIELFGVYWHNLFDVAERTEHFRQYGFQTLIIWEDELNDTDKVIHKIKMFTRK